MSEKQYKASAELDKVKLGTAKEERRRTKAWMETASFHCRNEFYWKERTLVAELELAKINVEKLENELNELLKINHGPTNL